MNAVIAPFKEPLPCQDTMEWPFCDCKPLLEVNHGGQSHGLLLYTAMCCCNSNYVIQQHWYFCIYFKGQQSMLFLLKQDSVLFCFLLFMLCTCLSHFGVEGTLSGCQLRYSPSGCTLKEWQFSTRLFELLICCWSPSVMQGSTGNAILMRNCSTHCVNVCLYAFGGCTHDLLSELYL